MYSPKKNTDPRGVGEHELHACHSVIRAIARQRKESLCAVAQGNRKDSQHRHFQRGKVHRRTPYLRCFLPCFLSFSGAEHSRRNATARTRAAATPSKTSSHPDTWTASSGTSNRSARNSTTLLGKPGQLIRNSPKSILDTCRKSSATLFRASAVSSRSSQPRIFFQTLIRTSLSWYAKRRVLSMTDMNSPPWTERFSRGPETYSNLLKRGVRRVFLMEYQAEKQKARCACGLQFCPICFITPFYWGRSSAVRASRSAATSAGSGTTG
jgi:hypothetical protein